MFQFSIKKETLLSALVTIAGAVDKKNSMAILSNVLLKVGDDVLSLTATDLEIEISAQVACDSQNTFGSTTVPAKKFMDIIRSLDENTNPTIVCDGDLLSIKQGRSFFKLAALPSENYPIIEDEYNEIEISLPRLDFLKLFQSTYFALSQQDVRVYLNGLFIEFEPNWITAVAMDGHRMALDRKTCQDSKPMKFLLPKKAVHELIRLLPCISDETILVSASPVHFKLMSSQFIFISKLIEARFPPYHKFIPKGQDKEIIIDCSSLKRAISRTIILANEKSRAILLHLQAGQLTLLAHNDHEEAMETLSAETRGDEIKIGLNASYLLDVLNYFGEGNVRLSMSNMDSSILIEHLDNSQYQYVIMPMKL